MGGRQCLNSLEIEPGSTVEGLRKSLDYLLEQNERKAPPTQLAKALAVLTAVCAKPADFDDAKVVLWSERLKVVLQEYPAEIALAAVSEWPQTEGGKWWPTEAELRQDCVRRMNFRNWLRHELEDELGRVAKDDLGRTKTWGDDGFNEDPDETTKPYVDALFAISYDTASRYFATARFGPHKIGVIAPMAAFTLERAAPGLLAEHGVRIVAPKAYDAEGRIVEWEP